MSAAPAPESPRAHDAALAEMKRIEALLRKPPRAPDFDASSAASSSRTSAPPSPPSPLYDGAAAAYDPSELVAQKIAQPSIAVVFSKDY